MSTVTLFELPKYCSPQDQILTKSECRSAVQAAVFTARELYADAVLLHQNHRFARAAAIAVLAIEEVGKTKVLLKVFRADNEAERRTAWNEYRRHRAKSAEMIAAGPGFSDDEVRSDFSRQSDALKQLGFYSNLLESGEWIEPEKVVDQAHASLAVQWAGALVDQLQSWESVAE